MKFIIFALILSIGLGYAYYNYFGEEDIPLKDGVKILGEKLAEKVGEIDIENNKTLNNIKEKAADMADMALGKASEKLLEGKAALLKEKANSLANSLFGTLKEQDKSKVKRAIENLSALNCRQAEETARNFFKGNKGSNEELYTMLEEMKNNGLNEQDILNAVQMIYCED